MEQYVGKIESGLNSQFPQAQRGLQFQQHQPMYGPIDGSYQNQRIPIRTNSTPQTQTNQDRYLGAPQQTFYRDSEMQTAYMLSNQLNSHPGYSQDANTRTFLPTPESSQHRVEGHSAHFIQQVSPSPMRFRRNIGPMRTHHFNAPPQTQDQSGTTRALSQPSHTIDSPRDQTTPAFIPPYTMRPTQQSHVNQINLVNPQTGYQFSQPNQLTGSRFIDDDDESWREAGSYAFFALSDNLTPQIEDYQRQQLAATRELRLQSQESNHGQPPISMESGASNLPHCQMNYGISGLSPSWPSPDSQDSIQRSQLSLTNSSNPGVIEASLKLAPQKHTIGRRFSHLTYPQPEQKAQPKPGSTLKPQRRLKSASVRRNKKLVGENFIESKVNWKEAFNREDDENSDKNKKLIKKFKKVTAVKGPQAQRNLSQARETTVAARNRQKSCSPPKLGQYTDATANFVFSALFETQDDELKIVDTHQDQVLTSVEEPELESLERVVVPKINRPNPDLGQNQDTHKLSVTAPSNISGTYEELNPQVQSPGLAILSPTLIEASERLHMLSNILDQRTRDERSRNKDRSQATHYDTDSEGYAKFFHQQSYTGADDLEYNPMRACMNEFQTLKGHRRARVDRLTNATFASNPTGLPSPNCQPSQLNELAELQTPRVGANAVYDGQRDQAGKRKRSNECDHHNESTFTTSDIRSAHKRIAAATGTAKSPFPVATVAPTGPHTSPSTSNPSAITTTINQAHTHAHQSPAWIGDSTAAGTAISDTAATISSGHVYTDLLGLPDSSLSPLSPFIMELGDFASFDLDFGPPLHADENEWLAKWSI